MTVLAFKMSRYANGVSCLHGPGDPESLAGALAATTVKDECRWVTSPTECTVRTWLLPPCRAIQPTRWRPTGREPARPKDVARIDSVFDAELWETHRTLKATLSALSA